MQLSKFQQKIISRALDRIDEFNEWEIDFINSIAEKDIGDLISTKQADVINNILKKLDS